MSTRRTVAPITRLGLAAALAGTVAVTAACGDDAPERTEGAYCTEVGNRLNDLNNPVIATADDVQAVLDSWRQVAARAPLAVEDDWAVVLTNRGTAATVDPNDAESVQRMADAARQGEPAATRVITYTYQLCGATIGGVTPVTTTPLQVPPTTG